MFKSIWKFVKFLSLVLIILGVILVYRAVQFQPQPSFVDKVSPLNIDYSKAVERFAGAIRFKTVSTQNAADRDYQEFVKFHQYLAEKFPNVHKALSLTKIGDYSLLYHWQASNQPNTNSDALNKKPILLMAHFDVVPVDPTTINDWSYPPFEGKVADGKVWGRGTLDDKGAVLALLEAVENLLDQGFTPSRDIYLVFGHDEEVGGEYGAGLIAKHLKEKKVRFEYVLDEGGFVTEGMMPGLDNTTAFIAVAEKGYMSVKLSVQTEGGHSSVPPKNTSIGILSQAIVNLEKHPFEARLVPETEYMLTTVGRHMPFAKRLIFANMWLFEPFLVSTLTQSKITNATVRTTTAVTVFKSGDKENALPITAQAIVNFRLLPGDTKASVLEHVTQSINDPRVKISAERGQEATPVADLASQSYQTLAKVVDQVSPEQNMVVVPNLMLGGTDSKHFLPIADNVYRLNGVKITPESFKGFHGTDEALSIDEYKRSINFYAQLIKQY